MTIRELSPRVQKSLMADCEKEYEEWKKRDGDRRFGTHEPLTPYEIFRHAFSRGVTQILLRIDNGTKKADV